MLLGKVEVGVEEVVIDAGFADSGLGDSLVQRVRETEGSSEPAVEIMCRVVRLVLGQVVDHIGKTDHLEPGLFICQDFKVDAWCFVSHGLDVIVGLEFAVEMHAEGVFWAAEDKNHDPDLCF